MEGVVQIRKIKILPLMFLLAFLTFTVLHFSNHPTHSHHDHKAVIVIEDLSLISEWDDTEKPGFQLVHQNELAFLLSIVVILHRNISRIPDKKSHLPNPHTSPIKLCNLLPCIVKLTTYNKGGKKYVDPICNNWLFFNNSSRHADISGHRNLPCFYGFFEK